MLALIMQLRLPPSLHYVLLPVPDHGRQEGHHVCLRQGIQFSVVLTEGRPDETGLTMARALDDMHVPVIAILDSAVAYALEAFRHGGGPTGPDALHSSFTWCHPRGHTTSHGCICA